MRGLTQYKKRNAGRNETRALWASFAASATKTFELKQVYREDLQTGRITESSRSKMNAEIWLWSNVFCPFRCYALPQSIAWEAMEKGAALFTERAKFWIENAKDAPTAAAMKEERGTHDRKGEKRQAA